MILLKILRLTCYEQLLVSHKHNDYMHNDYRDTGHAPHTNDPSASQRDCKDPCKMTHTIFAFSTRHPIATQSFPALRPAASIEVKVVKRAAKILRAASIVAACFASCTLGVGRLPWRRKKLHEQQSEPGSFAEQPAHLGVGMDEVQG